MSQAITVGVLGATSPAGRQVLVKLAAAGHRVVAFSRSTQPAGETGAVRWVSLADSQAEDAARAAGPITVWIALCHIWVVGEHFDFMRRLGAQRVVCLSSTSRYTKISSQNAYEEALVRRLSDGERALAEWAEDAGIGWTVLRPTLIYGRSTDRNLSEIVRIIRKLHIFPVFGRAGGMRQPVYVDDVAQAAVLAAFAPQAANKGYNISGAEVLSYREMVTRIFKAMGRAPRLLTVPIWLFNSALFFLRLIPRYRNWNSDMVQRMNRDMVFAHDDAARDFDFKPQPFVLRDIDVL
ncbi:NAD dependent epimerase/dehydratase family protein 7 [Achromobacter xylosoxidans A8]|uniref:NAD dependent epimerase/dehydratase family protein 7 n=1 Tax=Achromobacter xylosoxidans (strain A8) TaxID=762376 RepID=E3HQF7_ACHXA|nr:NAD-dependent epimerase/dehydratase family protein [Achromobacter xylosoxidans]ADP19591.1 NAD dependent epimerase/dehydratase family protein 7 [Achromobacter xylosoxidans A8]